MSDITDRARELANQCWANNNDVDSSQALIAAALQRERDEAEIALREYWNGNSPRKLEEACKAIRRGWGQ
jgi:hypothetical protein